MSRSLRIAFASIALCLVNPSLARAVPTFDHAPPGTITKQLTVYLSGEAMNSKYVAVASRALLVAAKGDAPAQYQPYLTIYAQNNATQASQYTRIYQSPGANDRLHILEKATKSGDSPMYFPVQEVALVGVAELTRPTVQQLVVSTHATGADCGGATIYALGMNGTTLGVQLKVTNPCDLSARVVPAKAPNGLASLTLVGPYYNATAALCCPTKPRAQSTLRWTGGAWKMTPRYFTLASSKPGA
jgi:hypothetical protein